MISGQGWFVLRGRSRLHRQQQLELKSVVEREREKWPEVQKKDGQAAATTKRKFLYYILATRNEKCPREISSYISRIYLM